MSNGTPSETPKRDWVATIVDLALRTLVPVIVMAIAIAVWQFLSEGGIVRVLGGVPASEFVAHVHDHEHDHVPEHSHDSGGVIAPRVVVVVGRIDVPDDDASDMYDGSGVRGVIRRTVPFGMSFDAAPQVMLGLTEFDTDERTGTPS